MHICDVMVIIWMYSKVNNNGFAMELEMNALYDVCIENKSIRLYSYLCIFSVPRAGNPLHFNQAKFMYEVYMYILN